MKKEIRKQLIKEEISKVVAEEETAGLESKTSLTPLI